MFLFYLLEILAPYPLCIHVVLVMSEAKLDDSVPVTYSSYNVDISVSIEKSSFQIMTYNVGKLTGVSELAESRMYCS